MAQKDNLLLVVGGLGILWLVSRRKTATAIGVPVYPPGSETGYAQVAGSLGSVSTAQEGSQGEGGGFSPLPIPAVLKYPGDSVAVTVSYNALTRDSNGQTINWPYRISIQMYRQKTWQDDDNWDEKTIETSSDWGYGKTASFSLTIPDDVNGGQFGTFRAKLWAATSDEYGNPVSGQWHQLGNDLVKDDLIEIDERFAYSTIGGSLGSIRVSNKGKKSMKRLTMRQSRPPGGFSPGIGEYRQWPRSGPNTAMPGTVIRARQNVFGPIDETGMFERVGPGLRFTVV